MEKRPEAHAVFNTIPESLIIVDTEGRIQYANSLAEVLFGYGPGQLVDLELEVLLPEQYRRHHVALRQKFAADPLARPMGVGRELRARKRDGREFPVEIGIGPLNEGRSFIAVIRDITPILKVRDRLSDSEAESHDLDQAFMNTPIGLCYFDTELRYLRINNWLAEMNGIPMEQHLGQKVSDILPSVSSGVEQQLRHVLRTGESIVNGLMEATTPAHPTTLRTYMHNYRADKSADGAVIGISCVVQDVTEAKQELEGALTEVKELKDRLQAENIYFQEEIKTEYDFDDIIGNSAAMMATLHRVEQVAETDATVLLLGETGTGKELLARAIHSRSKRNTRPLIKVDCTTLPPGLMESDLFGHQKGAFTGAYQSKPGRFELADGGTIFLDEIGELPIDLQGKLLRVIQEGEFQRLGSQRVQKVDVRIIAATNRDLHTEMREQRFRADLYYRLGVFPIEIPPLRDRRDDIPLLTAFIISQRSKALGKRVISISKATRDALVAYDWPGNIRELQNLLERALILSSGSEMIFPEELPRNQPSARDVKGPLDRDLKEIESLKIRETLEKTGWKIKGEGNAASRLGLKPSTLRSRMKTLGITRR